MGEHGTTCDLLVPGIGELVGGSESVPTVNALREAHGC